MKHEISIKTRIGEKEPTREIERIDEEKTAATLEYGSRNTKIGETQTGPRRRS
ncbi:hypothetical protein SESBI_20271 [Sesbania bispinosa]|nr:hypothetical protein SESBI_20271 [Sesbania bispinosa]